MRSGDGAPDDLLTTQEVADRVRVSTTTITRWHASGRLPGVKIGPRTFRFRRSDVEALVTPAEPTEAACNREAQRRRSQRAAS